MPVNETTKASVQAFYHAFHGVLGVYVSNRCNLSCRHCCSVSGPHHEARINLATLEPQIRDAIEHRGLKAVHLTGGEPFLFQDVLDAVSLIGAENGVSVVVNTNAFWARTVDQARVLLQRFYGITELFISADVYHEEFLPLERVVNAAVAAVGCGLLVQINACTASGGDDCFVSRLRESLPLSIREAVPINVHQVLPTGRAAILTDVECQMVKVQFPAGACQLLNRPVILEDGTVAACCNTVAAEKFKNDDSELILGDIGTDSLSEILSRADSNLLIHTLRAFGPSYIATRLPSSVQQRLPKEHIPGDICALCTELQRRELRHEVVAILRKASTKRQVGAALALHHEEDRLL